MIEPLKRLAIHIRYNLPKPFYQFTLVEWFVVAIGFYVCIKGLITVALG